MDDQERKETKSKNDALSSQNRSKTMAWMKEKGLSEKVFNLDREFELTFGISFVILSMRRRKQSITSRDVSSSPIVAQSYRPC